MWNKILMTTGFSFEGYSISKYLGVFSGECALGTGFLSSLGSDIADMLGTNSTSYSNKLRRAKEHALEQLQDQTSRAGGNAIIGLSINYTMFSRDIIGVIANGTAVKIEEISYEKNDDIAIPILKYNKNTAFRPVAFNGNIVNNEYAFSVELYPDSEELITSILVDLKFVTVFEQVHEFRDVAFTKFSPVNERRLLSGYTMLSLPCEHITLLKNVTFITKKYIQNDVLVDISSSDLEQELVSQEDWYADKPSLSELEALNSMKEIYEYLKDSMEVYHQKEPELMEWLEKHVELERIYGNLKKDAIDYIKKYYKLD